MKQNYRYNENISVNHVKKKLTMQKVPKFHLISHDTNGVKLLSHLRLKFSLLNEHEFRHNFNNTSLPHAL